jgi:hypothetical protein
MTLSDVKTLKRLSATVAIIPLLLAGSALAHEAHQQENGHAHAIEIPADAAVPLFEGLGNHHFSITTSSETAQAYFNQGLTFTYGFNHFEAIRSFE